MRGSATDTADKPSVLHFAVDWPVIGRPTGGPTLEAFQNVPRSAERDSASGGPGGLGGLQAAGAPGSEKTTASRGPN